jgi:hypothetical protein
MTGVTMRIIVAAIFFLLQCGCKSEWERNPDPGIFPTGASDIHPAHS